MLELLCIVLSMAQPTDGHERTEAEWAAPGMLRNPVAITFDPSGRLYVVESDRAGNAVTDTRGLGHLDAVIEDMRLRTVEDRRALIEKWVAGGHFDSDYFTRTDDRIRRLADTDGDGVADESTVFADGFNDAVDGIAAGAMWLGDTLYFTNIPHLWALRDTDGDGRADERTSLSYGYGVRWCFYGHDLHGLALGPDGRIYFSMGDRGYNIETPEGRSFVGYDRGGVFRCRPDGSELELYYEGLRNPQELAFDAFGNLFTGDNNCDSGDRARMVHVVEGGDSGWRQDVQSLPSRGPWNREFMWNLRSDHVTPQRPAWSLPPVAHVGAGPSGIAYYPGTGESQAYDDQFFFVDFYGRGSTVHTFRMVPDGAWFSLQDQGVFYEGRTVTDVAFGYDGRLYLSDWGGGWSPNENGNVFTITNDSVRADASEAAAIAEVERLFIEGFGGRRDPELGALLGHRDQRVRLAAQYELAGRDEAEATAAPLAADLSAPLLQRIHAIWTLGMSAVPEPIVGLLNDETAQIRVQAMRTLGDLRAPYADRFLRGLKDADAQVRFHSAIALGRTAHGPAIGPLLELLDSNDNRDPMIRHASAYALALIDRPDDLIQRAQTAGAAGRLGAVLALRRTGHPGLASFLGDADAGVVIEAARALYDNRVGLESLAGLIDVPLADDLAIEPLMRRAIEANVLLGQAENVDRLARFVGRAEASTEWLELAVTRIEGWDRPLQREGVWGNLVEFPGRDEGALRDAVLAHLGDAAVADDDLAARVEGLQARFAIDMSPEEMVQAVRDVARSERSRLVLLDRVAAEQGVSAVSALLADPNASIRMRVRELLVDAGSGLDAVEQAIGGGSLAEQQHAIGLLARAGGDAAELNIDDPALGLEVHLATSADHGPPPGSALEWGGDVGRGRSLVLHHISAQCVRCHEVGGVGGGAGPSLDTIGSLLTRAALVESLLDPNARIAPGYGTVTVTLASGERVEGTIVSEDSTELVLQHEGVQRTVRTAQIADRIGPVSAMTPMGAILKPRELRDVVAYLASLQDPERGPAVDEVEPDQPASKIGLTMGQGLAIFAGFIVFFGLLVLIAARRTGGG